MSNYNQEMIEKYRGNFLKEVQDNVEEGDWVKMCMQCGVCSGSCPLVPHSSNDRFSCSPLLCYSLPPPHYRSAHHPQ